MDNPSLNQLQDHLNAKSQQADTMRKDIAEMKQKVEIMEKQLADFIGENQGIQLDGKQPLRQFIVKVLSESNEPLTVNVIADLVIEAGYKTTAPANNFRNIIHQTLGKGDDFRRVTKSKVRPARYTVE